MYISPPTDLGRSRGTGHEDSNKPRIFARLQNAILEIHVSRITEQCSPLRRRSHRPSHSSRNRDCREVQLFSSRAESSYARPRFRKEIHNNVYTGNIRRKVRIETRHPRRFYFCAFSICVNLSSLYSSRGNSKIKYKTRSERERFGENDEHFRAGKALSDRTRRTS